MSYGYESPLIDLSVDGSGNWFLSVRLLKLSTENLTEFKFQTHDLADGKSLIEIDYHLNFYKWKSTCKKFEIKLHFNKRVFLIRYPIKVPHNELDEYEMKYDVTNLPKNLPSLLSSSNSKATHEVNLKIKNLFKYTYNEEEYSTLHIPKKYQDIYETMLRLIDGQCSDDNCKNQCVSLEYESALPLHCEYTHLHRFDDLHLVNEPKVVFLENAWYKYVEIYTAILLTCS